MTVGRAGVWLHKHWRLTTAYVILAVAVAGAVAVDGQQTRRIEQAQREREEIIDDALQSRRASCRATISALNGVQANALAGVRKLPAAITTADPQLQASFDAQRATTERVNAELNRVAQLTQADETRLRRSSFCQDFSGDDPVVIPPTEGTTL